MMTSTSYREFLAAKAQLTNAGGFDPHVMPEHLFDFQAHLVDWAVRQGRGAIFADCGLGKTPMELAWAENVHRQTGRPVLLLTPLREVTRMPDPTFKRGDKVIWTVQGKEIKATVKNVLAVELDRPAPYVRIESGDWMDWVCVAASELRPAPLPEPTGLGAIVRDCDGDLWIRHRNLWHQDTSRGRGIAWSLITETLSPLTLVAEGWSGTGGDSGE